jgi:hypothetical protein
MIASRPTSTGISTANDTPSPPSELPSPAFELVAGITVGDTTGAVEINIPSFPLGFCPLVGFTTTSASGKKVGEGTVGAVVPSELTGVFADSVGSFKLTGGIVGTAVAANTKTVGAGERVGGVGTRSNTVVGTGDRDGIRGAKSFKFGGNVATSEVRTVGTRDRPRRREGDGDGMADTFPASGGMPPPFVEVSILLAALELHFPAAQKPPTTAPATKREFSSRAATMTVTQKRRSEMGRLDPAAAAFSELLLREAVSPWMGGRGRLELLLLPSLTWLLLEEWEVDKVEAPEEFSEALCRSEGPFPLLYRSC